MIFYYYFLLNIRRFPDKGITGNSHFMFQELNNELIAKHIDK
jgi:hypothetical protein